MYASRSRLGTGVTILIAVGTAYRSLRHDMRRWGEHADARFDADRSWMSPQIEQLRERIDTWGQPRARGVLLFEVGATLRTGPAAWPDAVAVEAALD